MSFKVQSKPCDTCIYTKNSASRKTSKQLEDEIVDKRDPRFFTGFRICHHSTSACCRSFWNKHKNNFQAGQLAQRLDCVEFVDHK